LPHSLFAPAQRVLSLPSFGDIARYLGKASQFSSGIVDWINHDVCPESLSTLREATAFLLEVTHAFRNAEVLRGQSSLDIFSRIK
jgi:hypothetical protein